MKVCADVTGIENLTNLYRTAKHYGYKLKIEASKKVSRSRNQNYSTYFILDTDNKKANIIHHYANGMAPKIEYDKKVHYYETIRLMYSQRLDLEKKIKELQKEIKIMKSEDGSSK